MSAALSISPAQSWYGGLRAPDAFMSMAIYGLVFFLSFFFFRRDDLPKIGIAAGSGLLIATVIGFFEAVRGMASAQNPVGSPWGWGILMVAVLAALIVVDPDKLGRKGKIIFFATAFVAFASLFLLNDEWLWFVLAAFVVIVAALRFGPRERFRYAFMIVVLALFFALVSSRLPALASVVQEARPGVTGDVRRGRRRAPWMACARGNRSRHVFTGFFHISTAYLGAGI